MFDGLRPDLRQVRYCNVITIIQINSLSLSPTQPNPSTCDLTVLSYLLDFTVTRHPCQIQCIINLPVNSPIIRLSTTHWFFPYTTTPSWYHKVKIIWKKHFHVSLTIVQLAEATISHIPYSGSYNILFVLFNTGNFSVLGSNLSGAFKWLIEM